MTLIDIKNLLFSHFLTESFFDLNEDISPIQLDMEGEGLATHKEAIFKAALDDFVRGGVLVEVNPGVYVLTQPIDAFSQTLVLTPMVAEKVGDLLEEVGFTQNGHPYRVNKLAINSDDINVLCTLCHILLEENQRNEDSPDDQ